MRERLDRAIGRHPGVARWSLALLVAVPAVVAIVAGFAVDVQPVADWALIELGVRDVGSHTPLVGPFSRYGWNHPGPLLFWFLAVPYRLFGSSPQGLLFGAGVINVGCILGLAGLAWRRGRWPLLVLVALGTALLLHGVGAGFLVDFWNPYLTMLPFGALVLVAWAIACGDVRLTPVAVVLAAFLVETHVGYVPVVGALVVWALLGLFLEVRWRGRLVAREHQPAGELDADDDRDLVVDGDGGAEASPAVWPWLLGSAVLGLVLVSPMVVEQFTRDPGNLGEIIRHFTSSEEATAGLGRALRVVGQHLAVPGVWISGNEPRDPFVGELVGGTGWWTLPLLAAYGMAVWSAWRGRMLDQLRLLITVGLGLVVGLLSISRTTDAMFPYLFQWMRPLTMLTWVAVLWVGYLALPDDWRVRTARTVAPVALAAIVLLTVLTTFSSTDLEITEGSVDDAVVALTPGTLEAVGDGPVLIWPVGGCLDWVANGLFLELERAGVPVLATKGDAHRYGRHRVYEGTDDAASTLVVACRDEIAAYAERDHFEAVARFSPLTAEQEAELEELEAQLRAEAVAEGRDELVPYIDDGAIAVFGPGTGLDEDVLDRYRALQLRHDERITAYLGPPIALATGEP